MDKPELTGPITEKESQELREFILMRRRIEELESQLARSRATADMYWRMYEELMLKTRKERPLSAGEQTLAEGPL
jgi:hypothetical protein